MTSCTKESLAKLLKERLEIIADHSFRDRDPEAHLNALRSVSENLALLYQDNKPEFPPRLRHFMEQCSYAKALDYLNDTTPVE